MYKYLLLLIIFISTMCTAQVVSIDPSEEFQGQTVSVTIKLAPGVIQAANPPADSFDVYIQQGATRINCNVFTPAQIYPGTQPYTDSLSADFSIPAGVIPGWYDVHVTTYTAGMVPVDNILANGFVVRIPGSCDLPFNVQDSSVTGTSAKVYWSPTVLADTFRVRYRIFGTNNYFYKDINGAGVSGTTLNNLLPGIKYSVDVSTICLGIHSTYSLPLDTFTTVSQTINCVIPFSINYSSITNSAVTIGWSINVTADTFRIRYKVTGSPTYFYKNVDGGIHSTTVNNLLPGTSYDFQVSSVCTGIGNGYSPVFVINTLSNPVNCAIPYGLSATAITNTTATIGWSNLVTADTFRLRFKPVSGSSFFYKDVDGSGGNSTILSGLLPGTQYQYQVSSKCSGAGTGYSSSLTFTTTSTPVNCTTIPFGLSTSNITNASATVTWTNLVTADSFLVRYSVNNTTNYLWKMVSGTAGNTTTLTGLTPNTTYQWQVRTKCTGAPATPYSASDVFGTPLRIASREDEGNALGVYPNPSSGIFTVEFLTDRSQNVKVEVIDFAGRIVYSNTTNTVKGTNSFQISLTDLSAGIYFLNVNGDNLNLRRRLIIE